MTTTDRDRVRLGVLVRSAVEQAGGLASRADLARRYGFSRPYMGEVTRRPDFPDPVTTIGPAHAPQPLWSCREIDDWMNA